MNGHVFRSRQPVASAPTHILDTFFKCFNQTWAQIGRFGRWKKFYLERWRWVSLCWTGLALKVWTEQQPSKSSRKRPNNRSCPFRCQFPLWSLPKTQFKETGQSTNSKTSAAFDCPRKREPCSCKLNWNFGNRLEINKHGWFFFSLNQPAFKSNFPPLHCFNGFALMEFNSAFLRWATIRLRGWNRPHYSPGIQRDGKSRQSAPCKRTAYWMLNERELPRCNLQVALRLTNHNKSSKPPDMARKLCKLVQQNIEMRPILLKTSINFSYQHSKVPRKSHFVIRGHFVTQKLHNI